MPDKTDAGGLAEAGPRLEWLKESLVADGESRHKTLSKRLQWVCIWEAGTETGRELEGMAQEKLFFLNFICQIFIQAFLKRLY